LSLKFRAWNSNFRVQNPKSLALNLNSEENCKENVHSSMIRHHRCKWDGSLRASAHHRQSFPRSDIITAHTIIKNCKTN
jgi:hypothetical protein